MIDVIIPYKNSIDYIHRICKTLNSQTSKKFKVYFISDGIKDIGERVLLDQIKTEFDYEIHFIDSCGPGGCRNYGISISLNEYFTFVDIDDELSSIYIESFIKLIKKKKLVDIYECLYLSKKPAGKVVSGSPIKEVLSGENRFKSLVLGGLPRLSWGKVYRRQYIQNIKAQFPVDIYNGEDHIFLFKVYAGTNNIEIIYEYLYFWIKWENTLTKRAPTQKTMNDFIDVLKMKYDIVQENDFLHQHNRLLFARRVFKEIRMLVNQVKKSSSNDFDLINGFLIKIQQLQFFGEISLIVEDDIETTYWAEFTNLLQDYDVLPYIG